MLSRSIASIFLHFQVLIILILFIFNINRVVSFKFFHHTFIVSRGSRNFYPLMTPPFASILESPSAERNKGPIWDVLSQKVIPVIGPIHRVVEIAAGCGVHTIYLVSRLLQQQQQQQQQQQTPSFTWLPTDPDYASRLSIDERVRSCSDNRLKQTIQPAQPLTLNEQGSVEDYWSNETTARFSITRGSVDLVISINQIHISPWSATVGLMRTASQLLKEGGVLYCYGPYKECGTAVESNLMFDQSLRARDPSWGVRDLEQVITTASEYGLLFREKVNMPANNLSVIFIKKNT